MKTHRASILALVALIPGCASVPDRLNAPASWANACYLSIDEDTRRIAGVGAIDCGLLRMDSDAATQDRVVACAKDALGRGRAFRFGFSSFSEDSAFCRVAIRTPGGQLWDFYYDNDVTGQLAQNGNHSTVWLSRCADVDFLSNTVRRERFFSTEGCSRDEEAEKKYFWDYHKASPTH